MNISGPAAVAKPEMLFYAPGDLTVTIVVPSVTIGDNTVIGAGSVVTKDIPANVVAVGNPCRVLRSISERDKEYFYRDRKINWGNL